MCILGKGVRDPQAANGPIFVGICSAADGLDNISA
jgi:hypothetical protein